MLADAVRPDVLKLRRDVHNLRHDRAAARLAPLRPTLDPVLATDLDAWCALAARADQRAGEAELALEAEKTIAAQGFRALFEHDAMARSIQLSGDQLYRGLRDFVSGEHVSRKPSKARVVESSLVNFAYRAALKPSPFGRFTEIGAFPPEDPGAAGLDPTPGVVTSVTTLNRVLVNWLLAALPRVPGGLESGLLVLNATLRADADSIAFVGVAPGGGDIEHIPAQKVLRMRREALVNALLAALPNGAAPAIDVLRALTEATGDAELSRNVVHGLIRAGVVFFRPDLDDHDPDYSTKLGAILTAAGTPETTQLAQHFAQLRRLETDFAEAPAAGRQSLLDTAHAAITGIAQTCSVSPPPEEVLRSPVFEDTPTEARPQTWDLPTVTRSLPALTGLWRLASLMDNGQARRLGLHAFATGLLGERTSLPFLDFFDAFSALSDQDQIDVLMGRGVDAVHKFQAQRTEALRTIRGALVPGDGVVHLDPEDIARACAGVQDIVDTESVTFRAQFARDVLPGHDRTLVVNGVLTGYGVYYSRFGSFITGSDSWSLRAAQRQHLAARFPDQVDFNAVLGFNFNLHPPLTGHVVDYPGGISHERTVHPLHRLDVRTQPGSTALRLWDAELDQPVNLVPMNFLTPIGVPLLYRLLEALSPSNRYLWKPFDDIMDGAEAEGSPRLVVGDVVADRRSWTVRAADIAMLTDLSRDSFAALLDFDAWRISLGLPRHAFVLCQTPTERAIMSGRSRSVTRKWADFGHLRRASVHKPMYVDFRNPYLVRSFAKSALSREDVHVSIRECLPRVEDYGPDTGWTAAEEFFVELCTD